MIHWAGKNSLHRSIAHSDAAEHHSVMVANCNKKPVSIVTGASSGIGLGINAGRFSNTAIVSSPIRAVKPAHLLRKKETQVIRSQRKKFVRTINSVRAREDSCYSRVSNTQEHVSMSMSSTDKGLLTPENCAVIFIDHQPQLLSAVCSQERQELIDNLLVLAKAAKIFGVPVILTAVESKEFSGKLTPQLQDQFPDRMPLKRSSMNAWDDQQFVAAVRQTGRKNFLIAALWSEACLAFPALQMLEEGYGVYAVKDASCGTNQAAHEAALRRVEQAGGVSLTALQVLLEFQRDWARTEHSDEVTAIVREHCCAYSPGAKRPALAVDKAPDSRRREENQRTAKRNELTQ